MGMAPDRAPCPAVVGRGRRGSWRRPPRRESPRPSAPSSRLPLAVAPGTWHSSPPRQLGGRWCTRDAAGSAAREHQNAAHYLLLILKRCRTGLEGSGKHWSNRARFSEVSAGCPAMSDWKRSMLAPTILCQNISHHSMWLESLCNSVCLHRSLRLRRGKTCLRDCNALVWIRHKYLGEQVLASTRDRHLGREYVVHNQDPL